MTHRTPRPYTGHRIERHEHLGQVWSQTTHDADLSGERTYRFNALGFRGHDFNAKAKFMVFVFGESDAFGASVESEETWPYQVALREAARRNVSAHDMCVMNFAECGSSNSAIARMVLTQCAEVEPDLVLINFAQHQRTEAYANGATFPIGPWHGNEKAEVAVRCAPEAGGLRERLQDQLARGRSFLRYCDHDQGLFQSVRDILLIQSTLRNRGIPAVAITREPEHFLRAEILANAALGPLIELIDPEFLATQICPLALIDSVDWRDDDQHFGPITHAAIAESVLTHMHDGTPPPANADEITEHAAAVAGVTESVRGFYMDLPFNYHGTQKAAIKAIREPTVAHAYPDLHTHLKGLVASRTSRGDQPDVSVLEAGCGAGWLSHGLALHYGVQVDAIDLTPAALERARELTPLLGHEGRVRFRECDIFEYDTAKRFDLIVSIGVLHHTGDARAALQRLVRYLAPGGHVYLGLYHAPGRMVFLDELRRIARTEGEKAAFKRYRRLDRVHAKDRTLARSWFRDQVLHPHETQHTLDEVCGWFDEMDLEFLSTSINRFEPFSDRELLFERELEYEEIARKALFEENRYFPGFFTAFARRPD